MYRELDNLLSAETTEDSWYDDGCIIASDILSDFRADDWGKLKNEALTKPLEWQKKLAYCMDNNGSSHEFSILLSLLSIDNEELFEVCIDSLRSFVTPESKQMILNDPSILQRINDKLPKASVPVKKILEDFLEKVHS
ncbi:MULTISPECIES: hypothetical protein [Bacillus]|uniref:hypothetical protein n=1 Tax=Bacillus TaxID=1386 RepID=UPI000C332BF7|nr:MULTISPECIES: hypothetical protein [Bacillus]MCA0102826.1 hypothetical protein [Bacillus subtilis]MCA1173790.1 hypothetical protein [Bacillus subtilis]MCM3058888.1 hypothetical protein [Bacillus subtilis]MEC0261214.1 hypothetical protein [Bacillus subtilis]PKF93727.1 hypothetical protein CWT11_08995 [Bacillus subtilis]